MKIRIDLKILFFLFLFFLTKQLKIYLIIMGFAFLHELAHLITAKILGFKIVEFRMMPFGFSICMVPNFKDFNRRMIKTNIIEAKKIIVAFAGPILNLIFAILFEKYNEPILCYSNLTVAIFNLIPIYPLDGGRILKSFFRILFDKEKANKYTNYISNFFAILMTMYIAVGILYIKNIYLILILGYVWILVIRENRRYEISKRIAKII